MIGYLLMAEGGCRLEGGSHGTLDVDFKKNPSGSTSSAQACEDYCSGSATCLAFEWEDPESSFGPKCEIWLVMPAYGENKPMHKCMLKLRAVPPPPLLPPEQPAPPSLPPPSAPDIGLALGLGVGGGVAALALLLLVLFYFTRLRRAKRSNSIDGIEGRLPPSVA